MYEKQPISVIALYTSNIDLIADYKLNISKSLASMHKVIPYRILTSKGVIIYIDRIKDIKLEVATKVGGLGKKYTCTATFGEVTKEIYIYKDDDDWCMEDEL